MYGVIHRALRQMVTTSHGPATWEEVAKAAETGDFDMLATYAHGDDVTERIVLCSAAAMGQAPFQFLENFGQYWIRFAFSGEYGHLMQFCGSDFRTIINNMNRLHQGVAKTMPGTRPPKFWIISDDGHTIVVRYESQRKGLTPFVSGLLKGLLTHLGMEGRVSVLSECEASVDFQIDVQAP